MVYQKVYIWNVIGGTVGIYHTIKIGKQMQYENNLRENV